MKVFLSKSLNLRRQFSVFNLLVLLVFWFVPVYGQEENEILSFGNQTVAEVAVLPQVKSDMPSVENPAVIDELDLKDVDIADVLKMISQKSGLNIVVGSSVTGKATLYLKNVTAMDVLDIVAKTNDLAYIQEAKLVHVMTGAEYEQTYG